MMGRRPGSRASRAERRMQKERAASALQRGLPVPTPLPTRARGADSARGSGSSAPPASRLATSMPNRRRMPLAVKLLGVGLAVLGVVYGMTLLRDHKAASAAPATIDAAVK